MPLCPLPCRWGQRRGVWCRGGCAPAGPPPTASAGTRRPASPPGPSPLRRARPLPAPRAALHAPRAASCSAGAHVLRRGEVCRPASEGRVVCRVPASAERAHQWGCACALERSEPAMAGLSLGPGLQAQACVSHKEPEAPRAGTTRGSLACRPCL